ncbi:hypothetical protein [Streptomyces alfalfae]
MKIQAAGLRPGDVIRTGEGTTVTVRDLKRAPGGCLTTNLGAPDQLDGHAWEWVEIISRGPEQEAEAVVPEECACPPGATGDEDAEPCGADDCEVAFRMEVGWPR